MTASQPRPHGEPGEPASAARAFQSEIREQRRYERGLAVKAVLSLALVAALLMAHIYLFS